MQLPTEVDEADRSVVGESGSVWLERRGGESTRLVVALEVIDLRVGNHTINDKILPLREYFVHIIGML